MNDLTGRTTVGVRASRDLGHGIATAFAAAGVPVVAVSRTVAVFPEPANGVGTIQAEIADAGDPTVAAGLIDRHEPAIKVHIATRPSSGGLLARPLAPSVVGEGTYGRSS